MEGTGQGDSLELTMGQWGWGWEAQKNLEIGNALELPGDEGDCPSLNCYNSGGDFYVLKA